jgi:3-hydroxyacyl-CoA dehydrogenase / enoyl-CoA hydratase / 3-hydroxybutyryl-CoA epimerase
VSRAAAMIAADLKKRVARRELKPHEARLRAARLTASTALDGLSGVDLAIEAAPERRDVKDAVLSGISAQVRADALIATNTSSYPLSDLATSVANPGRFLGLHFFNPAPKMPLVEVVRGGATSERATLMGVRFAKDLGKTPLVVADGPGFFVNRVLAPYLREACALAEEGVPIASIDAALSAYGMPMGPFALMDTIGLDVLKDAGDHFAARGLPGAHPVVARLFEAKRLGRKSGRGFYVWSKTGERSAPDDSVFAARTRATPTPDAIMKRLVDAMANEARAAVKDGLVASETEADLGSIFGAGFPPFRGGLLRATAPLAKGGAS